METVRAVCRVAVIVLSIAAMAWFWDLSQKLTESPQMAQFAGSVEVLLKNHSVTDNSVKSNLTVRHWLETSDPNDIRIEYVVCSEKPGVTLEGVFVFSGNARLSNPTSPLTPTGSERVGMIPGNLMAGTGPVPVELYSFQIPLTLCAPDGSGEGPVPVGSAIVLAGTTQAPVAASTGIRSWFSPPAVGYLPGTSGSMLGTFAFDAIDGEYSRAIERSNTVRLTLPGWYTAELDRPDPDSELSDDFITVWQAKAETLIVGDRLVDEDGQSVLQYQLIAASIGIGIGGNILASLLWGLVAPGPRSEGSTSEPQPSSVSASTAIGSQVGETFPEVAGEDLPRDEAPVKRLRKVSEVHNTLVWDSIHRRRGRR